MYGDTGPGAFAPQGRVDDTLAEEETLCLTNVTRDETQLRKRPVA